ncbi:hypothetical protein B0H13DRAFT_2674322 [Mycena leptocephala]|nr:hypothetical protein B0H13DRAFT_2674322 [Mycena leptocephala]
MTGVASRNSALQISEIRVSCTKPTKLRVLMSVKTALTKDKATLLHEAESKAEERELAMHIYPSSIDDSSGLLVLQVYRRHHWPRPDEQLLKKEFSFATLLQYCSGQSESRVYEIFRKDGIIVSAELKVRNELGNTDSSAPELPDNSITVKTVESDVATNAKGSIDVPSHSSELTKIDAVNGSSKNTAVISNLLAALEIVQQVGKIVESAPFIEPIGAILSEVVKVYKEVKDNHGKRDALLEKVASLALDIGKAILRLKDSGHAGSISRLQSDLEEYTGLLKEARELIGAFDDRGGFIRIVKRGELAAGLDSLDRSLDLLEQDSGNNRLVDIQISLGTVAEHVSKTYDTVLEVKLEQWLNAPDPKEKHARSCGLRQESTCLWLLQHKNFIHWQDNPGKLLWIEGPSGTGKTILSSTVIEELFKHRGNNTAIAYFHFDFSDDRKQSMEIALRRLVLQLSRRCPKLLQELECTYLILDALDECRDYDVITRFVQTITAWSGIRLHVLITSQPRDIFETSFSSLRNLLRIPIQKNTTSEDIDLFVKSTLASNKMLKAWGSKSATIIARIIQKSNGMFRLAYCLLQELERCKKPAELDATLDALPNTLHDIYARWLSPEMLPARYLPDMEKLLHWIVYSARPLTVAELEDTIAFDFSNSARYIFDPVRRTFRGAFMEWMSGLVSVNHPESENILDPDDVLRGDCIVSLAHSSVQDYLLLPLEQHPVGCNACPIHVRETVAHPLMAEICIDYLLHFADPTHPLNVNTFPDYPLASYAAQYWGHHLLLCDESVRLFDSAMHLMKCGSRQYLALNHLCALRSYDRRSWWSNSVSTSPFSTCSRIGYFAGMKYMLQDHEVDTKELADALWAASHHGHTDIVRLLLANGAVLREHDEDQELVDEDEEWVDEDSEEQVEDNALSVACMEGHTEIVRLLIASSVNVNTRNRDYGSALQAACQKGHTEIVRLLITNNADIEMPEGGPLAAACGGGHIDIASSRGCIEIVHLLLDKGADVNTTHKYIHDDYDLYTALMAASFYGHIGIKSSIGDSVLLRLHRHRPLLLESGARIEEKALEAACAGGDLNIVRLLFERQAEHNINSLHDALQAACDNGTWMLCISCSEGHIEIVRLLLENGAHVNQASIDWSALCAASWNGHIEVVRLLLENGAHNGHIEIVRLLLERARTSTHRMENMVLHYALHPGNGTWTSSDFAG